MTKLPGLREKIIMSVILVVTVLAIIAVNVYLPGSYRNAKSIAALEKRVSAIEEKIGVNP